MPPINTAATRPTVLVFAPEGTLVPHLSAAHYCGQQLAATGATVYAASCFGRMPRCLVKDSVTLPAGPIPPQRCASCVQGQATALLGYGALSVDLRAYADVSVQAQVAQAMRAADVLSPSFCHDGVAVGAYAHAALYLNTKRGAQDPVDDEARAVLLETIEHFLLSIFAVRALMIDQGIDTLLVFGQYAQNWAAIEAARSLGVRWRILDQVRHLNINRQRLLVRGTTNALHHQALYRRWLAERDRPLAPRAVVEVLRDIVYCIGSSGSHIYAKNRSATSDLPHRLGLRGKGVPVIGVFTSSLDEFDASRLLDQAQGVDTLALEHGPWPTQVDFLQALIGWARAHDDVDVVIRIHPREDANHRDAVVSTHLALLRSRLVDPPFNVHMVWPRDEVSSYDLIDELSVAVVGWSTFAIECARIGIPCLTPWAVNPTFPTGVFVDSADTAAGFFELLQARAFAVEEAPAVFARITWALRFYIFIRFTSTIDLSDVVPEEFFDGYVPPRASARAPLLRHVLTCDEATEDAISGKSIAGKSIAGKSIAGKSIAGTSKHQAIASDVNAEAIADAVIAANLADPTLYSDDDQQETLVIAQFCAELQRHFARPERADDTRLLRRLALIAQALIEVA